jgi:hypothetical protein
MMTAESHQSAAAHHLMAAAPPEVQSKLNDAIAKARASGVDFGKILLALATAAAGGFSAQSIAAALAILFGTGPTP